MDQAASSQPWRKVPGPDYIFGARHQLAGSWKVLVFARYANERLELS